MRILTFLAKSFAWQPFSQTLTQAPAAEPGSMTQVVVAFIQVEAKDEADEKRAFRHLLKHLKWLANKNDLRNIVLHSFTHLGGQNASADFAESLLQNMAQRLRNTGYQVEITPFGWFCSWQIDVMGQSLAKVYKEI
jgi:hypothetical protein